MLLGEQALMLGVFQGHHSEYRTFLSLRASNLTGCNSTAVSLVAYCCVRHWPVIMLLIRLVLMIKMEHPAAQLWFLPHTRIHTQKKIIAVFLQMKQHLGRGPRDRFKAGFHKPSPFFPHSSLSTSTPEQT